MKNRHLVIMILLFSFSNIALSAPVRNIFIGNPGAGKSTLISSLVGEHIAPSGISAGIGLTRFFREYPGRRGQLYLDTPGLADIRSRKEAGQEIENALKQNGEYRIFFVITLDTARVRSEDIATITTVMEAIKTTPVGFNVIINKVTPRIENLMMNDNAFMAQIFQSINSGAHKVDLNSIKIIPNDRAIEEADNAFIAIDDSLDRFIHETSIKITIARDDVEKIKTDQYEALKEQHAEEMRIVQKEIAEGHQKYAVLLTQMTTLQDDLKQAKEKAKKDIEKVKNESSAELKKLKDDFTAQDKLREEEHKRRMKKIKKAKDEAKDAEIRRIEEAKQAETKRLQDELDRQKREQKEERDRHQREQERQERERMNNNAFNEFARAANPLTFIAGLFGFR